MHRTIGKVVLGLFTLSMSAALGRAEQPPAPTAAPPAPPQLESASTNNPGPKIQFDNAIHDFGKAKSGEPVKYTYYFTNTGDQVLEITHVQPSCGCTTAGD